MHLIRENMWLKLAGIPVDAKWSLICFPFAGGYAEYFLPWYQKLAQCAFYPIQLPGRSYRWQEPGFVDINCLIDSLLPNLIPIFEARPYVLFGHSMGAYITWYIAKKIKELGLNPPIFITVSSAPAPQYWESREKISALSPETFTEFFKTLGGFNPEILKHESFMKLQMDLLRQDVMLCESCEYSGLDEFAHPILALSSPEDPYVLHENMLGWSQETKNEFQLESFEGGHFYLNQNIDKILSIIQAKL